MKQLHLRRDHILDVDLPRIIQELARPVNTVKTSPLKRSSGCLCNFMYMYTTEVAETSTCSRASLGTKKDPALRTKAADSLGQLMYCQTMATKFGGKFGPSVRHMEVTAEYTRALSTEASQGCRWSACCSRQRVHYSVLFLFDEGVQRMRKRKNLWSVLELPTAPRDHMWGHTRSTRLDHRKTYACTFGVSFCSQLQSTYVSLFVRR